MIPDVDKYRAIFFDFDGVIKESVEIKAQGYLSVFENCNLEVLGRISQHSLDNAGLSRYERIPLYMQWAGLDLSYGNTERYLNAYSNFVMDRVVESKWVPGVLSFLRANKATGKLMFLVSATPQAELLTICNRLALNEFFLGIFGSPKSKVNSIQDTLSIWRIDPRRAVLIGDSIIDCQSADVAGIEFCWRTHGANLGSAPRGPITVFQEYCCG